MPLTKIFCGKPLYHTRGVWYRAESVRPGQLLRTSQMHCSGKPAILIIYTSAPSGTLDGCFKAQGNSAWHQGKNAGKLKASAPIHHVKTPDLDKAVRGVADSISDAVASVLLRNDSQIVSIHATKRYQTDDFLGAIITVTALS